MKHFLLILVLSCLVYSGWQVLDRRERKGVIKTTKAHAPALLAISVVATLLLIVAFYLPAVKLL